MYKVKHFIIQNNHILAKLYNLIVVIFKTIQLQSEFQNRQSPVFFCMTYEKMNYRQVGTYTRDSSNEKKKKKRRKKTGLYLLVINK